MRVPIPRALVVGDISFADVIVANVVAVIKYSPVLCLFILVVVFIFILLKDKIFASKTEI